MPKHRLYSWAAPVAITVLVLAAFWPAIHAGFVLWDDDLNFLNNLHYRGLGWQNLRWMFTTCLTGPYQPLSWMSLGLDYLIWGMNPHGYHLSNILLHMLNAVLCYFLVGRLLRLGSPAQQEGDGWTMALASAAAALFFALHPLRVESVAWITERRDVLSGSFYLATLFLYLRACSGKRNSLRWALLCYVLSLSAKAMGMTLPVVLVVLDAYPLRRLPGNPKEWASAKSRSLWMEKVSFLSAAVVAAVIAWLSQRLSGTVQPWGLYGIVFHLGHPFYGLAFYLWKTLVPLRLLPLYAIPAHLPAFPPTFLASMAVVSALSLLLIQLRHRWPAGLAAWACYIVTLAPVLGVVPHGGQLAADRYTYLPCLAWAALLGAAIFLGLKRLDLLGRRLIMLAASAGILALGTLTWRQCWVWQDSLSLWEQVLRYDPQCAMAHNNLGLALAEAGKTEEAVVHYREALRMVPGLEQSSINLGLALSSQGKTSEAIALYDEVLRRRPDSAAAHADMSLALSRQGRLAEAMTHYQRVVELDPGLTPQIRPALAAVLFNQGLAFAGRRMLPEAIEQYEHALALDPHMEPALQNLGVAYQQLGRLDEAVAQFSRVIQIDPRSVQAYNNIGAVLGSQGRVQEAIAAFRAALTILPSSPDAQRNLAIAVRQTMNVDEPLSDCRAYAALAGLIFPCLLPFSGKAFHLDDPLCVYTAQQIAQHPLDPYGFRLNWFGTDTPMTLINTTTP